MVESITNRTPSDISLNSATSTSTTLKFTKSDSQAKLETMNSSQHSLNDWKPLKPMRTSSSSDEGSFWSDDLSTTCKSTCDESSITMSEHSRFEHDCGNTLVSEITEASLWSFRCTKRNPRDSLSLFYGEDAVQYIPPDDENDIMQANLPRPLHDSFGSNDVPPVPVRRNVSSDGGSKLDMDAMDKFMNGSLSDLNKCHPPKPPRRQTGSGNELKPMRRSSTTNVSSHCNSSDGRTQPRRSSTSNVPVLGSIGGQFCFHRRSSLPTSKPESSDKPSNTIKGPIQARPSSLPSEPVLGSNDPSKFPRRRSLPGMPDKGSFRLEDIMRMPTDSSLEDKFMSESLSSIGCNTAPKFPRRSSFSLSNIGSTQAEPNNTLMKRARKFTSVCSVSTHSYHLKKYTGTFVGSEAVDLMLKHGLAKTREDAVFLGHRFCKEFNLFHHVCFDHTFKDGNFFYRFTDGVKEDLSALPYTSLEDLRSLGDKFSESMEVSRHSSLMKTYKNSFMGSRAVDHMLAHGIASTRMHAVFLGKRMMEELNLFQHVSDQHQFKDSPHLYRFVAEQDRSSFEESTESLAAVMSTIRSHRLMKRRMSGGSERLSGRRASFTTSDRTSVASKSTGSVSLTPPPKVANIQKRALKVTFGNIQLRCFERCLEYNPSTTKGPSLGLGWRFYDEPPVSVDESYLIERSRYGFRLTGDCRRYILMVEWGYSKSEIRKATKKNEKIRQNRKKSFNKVTVVRSFVSEKMGFSY